MVTSSIAFPDRPSRRHQEGTRQVASRDRRRRANQRGSTYRVRRTAPLMRPAALISGWSPLWLMTAMPPATMPSEIFPRAVPQDRTGSTRATLFVERAQPMPGPGG